MTWQSNRKTVKAGLNDWSHVLFIGKGAMIYEPSDQNEWLWWAQVGPWIHVMRRVTIERWMIKWGHGSMWCGTTTPSSRICCDGWLRWILRAVDPGEHEIDQWASRGGIRGPIVSPPPKYPKASPLLERKVVPAPHRSPILSLVFPPTIHSPPPNAMAAATTHRPPRLPHRHRPLTFLSAHASRRSSSPGGCHGVPGLQRCFPIHAISTSPSMSAHSPVSSPRSHRPLRGRRRCPQPLLIR